MRGAMTKALPSTLSVIATLAGVSLRRLLRSRAVWVVLAIALLPAAFASFLQGDSEQVLATAKCELLVMALLPSIVVASAIGEEIEDRTTTYLWSRPLGRWTVIAGKLVALAPAAALIVAASWAAAQQAFTSPSTSTVMVVSTLGFAAGALIVSTVAASIAVLVPKHGMSLSIVYLVIIDFVVGEIPASLQAISITHQTMQIVRAPDGGDPARAALTLAIIAAVWFGVALLRLRRLES